MIYRFLELKVDNKIYEYNAVELYLVNSTFNWILEWECENVKLEIKDNILFFISGIIYYGDWKWGVFKSGKFLSGIWHGGILYENGEISKHVKWINGVIKQ